MNKNHGWPDIGHSEKPCEPKSDKMDISLLSTDPRNCEKCGYEAEDMYDLDAHTWSEHDEDTSDVEISEQVNNHFKCNFCDETFATKRDLMQHKKRNHEEKVAQCWQYSSGSCAFGDQQCWFNHTKSKTFKCSWCDEVFTVQSDFLFHKKKKHIQFVPICKNLNAGSCIYGKELCWFKHNCGGSIQEGKEPDNHEIVMHKIIQMMEKISERMYKIEENNSNIHE